jgi:hypothetical protein
LFWQKKNYFEKNKQDLDRKNLATTLHIKDDSKNVAPFSFPRFLVLRQLFGADLIEIVSLFRMYTLSENSFVQFFASNCVIAVSHEQNQL